MSRNAPAKFIFRNVGRATLLVSLVVALATLRAQEAQHAHAATNAPPQQAQVVIVEDPEATYDLQPVPERISAMIARAMTNLTGKATTSDAWRSLVSSNDIIGVKVNSAPGPNSGTRSAVTAAVVQGLLAAGIPTNQIIVWDKRAVDLRLAGYFELESRYGIKVMSSVEAGYDQSHFYEAAFLGPMDWSDVEYNQKGPGVGRKSYVTKLVSQKFTKIINISPLLHHNVVGVTGSLYTLSMSSVDNTLRFENNALELNKAIPEIYAMPILGDRVVLNIVDALICQYEGQQHSLLHYSAVLNQLRFSRDPVALDTLSVEEIAHQCELANMTRTKTNQDLLSNASLLEIGISDPKRINVTTLK